MITMKSNQRFIPRLEILSRYLPRCLGNGTKGWDSSTDGSIAVVKRVPSKPER